ncbi:hypothetical protein L596_002946 [Steinernema carpocapsae]|uniref:Xylose isomerase-like TIM barrel domain-containing protein n=1 Tax=Steinernema carpocapsae TaxID=34508 RepID=A0A4U8UUU6_STECR|nr:hypothetical protein L596_002946 [Steinernema carpocapsae]
MPGESTAPAKRKTKRKKPEPDESSPDDNSADDPSTAEDAKGPIYSTKFSKARIDTRGSKKLLGAHVSAAGGPHNAIKEAFDLGCRSCAFFLKNQRSWKFKEMTDEQVEKFNDALEKYKFDVKNIVPHTSYLVNAGSPNAETLEKSRANLLEDCLRCERLGICLLNMHPGSSTGNGTKDECIQVIAESINEVLAKTSSVIMLVESMAGQGNTVGGKFEELRDIIALIDNKDRIGVCLDTCHMYAAGFDIRTKESYERVMKEFEDIVGFDYLKAIHLNDSKGKLGSFLDRHEDIDRGYLRGSFTHIMNDPRLDGIPIVLETPSGFYSQEMARLYAMCQKETI